MKQAALHITNGDSAVDLMRAIELPGDYLAWRDVLHSRPVPAGLPLDELSMVRAGYIGGLGWVEFTCVQRMSGALIQSTAHCVTTGGSDR